MRYAKSIAAALIAGGLTAAGAAAAENGGAVQTDGTRTDMQQQRQVRSQLTMREVIDRVERAGYSHVREIERENGGWEVRARDANGRQVELYVDGRDGNMRLDDDD